MSGDQQKHIPWRIALMGAGSVMFLLVLAGVLRGVLGQAQTARRSALDAVGRHAGVGELLPGGSNGTPEAKPPASPAEMAELQKSWIGSQTIAPRNERVDRTTGERTLPFQGFGLQVDTSPPGARIVVNGEEMGTSPLLTTVQCEVGDTVAIEATRGAERSRARTQCRKDILVKLRMYLR